MRSKADMQAFKTGASLRPGQRGTAAELEKYGEDLLCVRYRYDRAKGLRHKTVEIIVSTATVRKEG